MDKKPNLQRIFTLHHFGQDGTLTLCQESRLDGEFGPVVIRCFCEMEGDKPALVCSIYEKSGMSVEELYVVRNAEMAYFVTQILPLFNPLTFISDALPFSSSSEEL